MVAAVFLRLATERLHHRLLTIGVVWHVTACRDRIPADEPVILTATAPPPDLACPACARDLAARVPTVDLRPSVRELGCYAELTVSADTDEDDWTDVDAAAATEAGPQEAVPLHIDELLTATSRPTSWPA